MSRMIPALLVFMLMYGATYVNGQEAWSPYPIIYIHGLNSDDKAWHETIQKLSGIHGTFIPNGAANTGNVFNAMLNRYADMTAMFGPDRLVGTADDDVYTQKSPLQPGAVFALNFSTSWNSNPAAPGLYFYQDHWSLGSRESQSNEAAIVKQGYALRKCIEAVISVTGAKKVILVGHSMGGLCIREYLQRRTNGVPRWWVDPAASDGHKVARVVTYGTPHYGSDASMFVPIIQGDQRGNDERASAVMLPFAPNSSSDAVRDLRYSYASGSQKIGIYLFGGDEEGLNTSVIFGWHNADVDCNGYEDDVLKGISQELSGTMPLPTNIRYTWITSNSGVAGAGDKVVEIERQRIMTIDGRAYPVGLADTLLTSRYHWNQTDDVASIARGLDEPSEFELAYDIEIGKTYRGGISLQTNGKLTDVDSYRPLMPDADLKKQRVSVSIRDLSKARRELYLACYDEAGTVLTDTMGYFPTGAALSLDYETLSQRQGSIYVVVGGNATSAGIQSPYELSSWYEAAINRPPELAAIKDTAMKYGTALSLPLNVQDESVADLSFKVSSSANDVVRVGDIVVQGTGTPRALLINPTGTRRGISVVSIDVSDGEFTTRRQFRLRVDDPTNVSDESLLPLQPVRIHIHPSVASTNAEIVFEVEKQIPTRVEVISHTGDLIGILYNGTPISESNHMAVSLSEFSSGLYWVRVVCGESIVHAPLMIVK
jgi:pimeloyl-ACP methyl ester carboxylesterase